MSQLLEKQFAFSDLENLYSKLLNKKIDRRNFKKIMSFGVIIESKNYAPKKGLVDLENFIVLIKNNITS